MAGQLTGGENESFVHAAGELKMDAKTEQELYAQLGHVVVQFNRLEWALRQFIVSLTPMPDTQSDLWFAQLSFNGHVNMADGLYRRQRADRDLAALDKLTRKLRDIEARRNRALHSMWMFNPETNAPVRAKSRARNGKLRAPDYDPNPMPELESLNHDLPPLIGEVLRLTLESRDP
jgi:hypothetical protein